MSTRLQAAERRQVMTNRLIEGLHRKDIKPNEMSVFRAVAEPTPTEKSRVQVSYVYGEREDTFYKLELSEIDKVNEQLEMTYGQHSLWLANEKEKREYMINREPLKFYTAGEDDSVDFANGFKTPIAKPSWLARILTKVWG